MQNFSKISIFSAAAGHISCQAAHSFGHSGVPRVVLTFPSVLVRGRKVPVAYVTCNPDITPYIAHSFRHSGLLLAFARTPVVTGTFSDRNGYLEVEAGCWLNPSTIWFRVPT